MSHRSSNLMLINNPKTQQMVKTKLSTSGIRIGIAADHGGFSLPIPTWNPI